MPRGRPRKDAIKETHEELINKSEFNQMTDKNDTLQKALQDGEVFRKEDIDKIIQQEIAKNNNKPKPQANKLNLDLYSKDSLITDREFIERLYNMNVPKEHLKYLNDLLAKIKNPKKIWGILREETVKAKEKR